MTTARHYLEDLVPNCATCGDGATDKCPQGHPQCKACKEELCPCTACLEERADAVGKRRRKLA